VRSLPRVLLAVSLIAACTHPAERRYHRAEAKKALEQHDTAGLVVGEFRVTKVSDGDTIRVDGLESSLRLLGIDTEEIYHHSENRRAVESDWQQYLKDQQAGHSRPVKLETPMGEQAMLFAQKWFDGVGKVRVERDDPAEIRDRYNRYLAYVFAKKNGQWVNYNVECVRAGMAPYFTKYGYSRRFHAEFVAALAEAKAAHRGIWAPGAMAAPDYPERELWWNARGEFVKAFRTAGEGRSDYVDVTHWNAKDLFTAALGKEVHVLGVVDDVRRGPKGPTRVTIGSRDIALVFFDNDQVIASGVETWKGEYIVATGIVSEYVNPHTKSHQLQIVIDRPSQIELSDVPGLTRASSPGTP
jgi:endonuclease YncB( thermonuclease family)